MSTILRLHATGPSTLDGWGSSGPLGPNEIKQMLDPDAGKAQQVAVAIPSPFARLHLVETALRFVREPGAGLGQTSVYHQLVSHFWDVWELAFNQLQNKRVGTGLRIRSWNRDTQLSKLREQAATQPLADVLGLFAREGRFRDFTDLFLLYAVEPGGRERLVGGTSPLTVFFPAPDLAPLPLTRLQGGGYYFDQHYLPLEKREAAFQDYIYGLFAGLPGLAALAPEVEKLLDRDRLQQLRFAGQSSAAGLPQLTDDASNPVTVSGLALPIRPDEGVVRTSDFVVQPTRAAVPDGPLPLVLRPGLQKPGKYYYNHTPFGDNGAVVPAHDPRPLADRLLPGPGLPYPYLTTDDWLETTLLTVPYELDGSKFETGQLSVAPGYQPPVWPLLPLKARYFDYFTQADLASHLHLTLEPACVRVRLRIPVGPAGSPEVVEYERAYYPNPRTESLGRLLTTNVGLSIFPFVKVLDAPPGGGTYNDFYKVMLVDANNIDVSLVNKPVELRFGVDGRTLTETGTEQSATAYRRTLKTASIEGSTYYEVRGTHFDYLEVLSPAPAAGRGLVVPRWREVRQGTKEFRFAIDFGTTNTHVAYHDAPGQAPQPLTFGPDDTPVALLKKPADLPELSQYERLFRGISEDLDRNVKLYGWQMLQQREFVPPLIGEGAGSPYQFPIRTATSEADSFAVEPAVLLGNVNVGFGINTEQFTNESYHTNLKWGEASAEARERVRMFFREMLLLFRSKAALNRGRLEATQVVWFAPLSFSNRTRGLYQQEWNRLFAELFHTSRPTTYLPESSAPYFYLTRSGAVTPGPGENAAFVDVGGGTSDILFFADVAAAESLVGRRHRPVFSSSFRFAGNDLWGDGAAETRSQRRENGLVRFGLDRVSSTPKSKSAEVALRCLDAVLRNSHFGSEEVASLLFSYEREFKFGEHLQHAPHLLILFYLHFGALVYHLGQLTALRGLQIPRYLCFTGRGSLYLRLLSPGTLRPLEQVARLILAETTGQPVPANFKILLADDPKQTTANGGVLATGTDADSTAEAPPLLQPVGTGAVTDIETQPLRPEQVGEEVKQAVLANVGRCLDLLLSHPELVRLQADLDIHNPPGQVRAWLDSYLADSFNLLRQRYADTLQTGDPIPETLFFLPLKHALYELSRELYAASTT